MWFCVIFLFVSWIWQYCVLIKFTSQSLSRIRVLFVVKFSLLVLEFRIKDHHSDVASGNRTNEMKDSLAKLL